MTNPDRPARPARPPRRSDRPGDAARALAVELCRRVEADGLFLDAAEAAAAERLEALEPRDRGLAKALCLTLWRRFGEIDRLIAERAPKTPPPPIRWLLRLAVAELLLRPEAAHGVVDSAVRRAKALDPRRSGFANAVLRRIAETLAARTPLPDARANAPDWLWDALIRDWGEPRAVAILRAHAAGAPLDLTPNPAKTDAPALAEALDGDPTPTGTVRLDPQGPVTALPGFAEGAWWVQDAAAALPAQLLIDGLSAGDRVLDLCAAPGGKTMQLAAAGLRATALDLSEARLQRVRENLERTGLTAELVAADARDWDGPAAFDAILLDAPCSATGTIRRHPELPWLKADWLADGLDGLTALQDALLDAAWSKLRPGGRLVFCTCSILKAEGEARADAFLARTADARPEPIAEGALGAPDLIDDQGRLRALPLHWPGAGGLDGFFALRVRKARSGGA